MSMNPPGTYVNFTDEYQTHSRWGGTDLADPDVDPEYNFQNLYYRMARLVIQDCLIYIQCDDQTYSWLQNWEEVPSSIPPEIFYIGQGADCNEEHRPHRFGGHQLNLDTSGLRFAPGMDWKVVGSQNAVFVHRNQRLKPQFSKIWGSGNCSRVQKVFGDQRWEIDAKIIPLTVFDSGLIKTSTLPITEGTTTRPVMITTTTLPALICSLQMEFNNSIGETITLDACPPSEFSQLVSYKTRPYNDYDSLNKYLTQSVRELGSEQLTFFDEVGTHWQVIASSTPVYVARNPIAGFEPLYIFTNRYFFYRSSCVFPLEFTANYSFLEKMHNETLVPEAYICTIQKFCPDFEPFQLCMTENATGGCFIRKECPTWAPKAYDLYSKEVMTHPYSCDVREFFETGRKSRVESDPETEVGQTVETCDEMGFAKLQTITKEVNFVSYFSLEVVGFEVYIGSNVNNWHNHSSPFWVSTFRGIGFVNASIAKLIDDPQERCLLPSENVTLYSTMEVVPEMEGNFTICVNQSACPFFEEFHSCMTCEQMCFVIDAATGCPDDSLFMFSFFSGWAREVFHNATELCEYSDTPVKTYKCDDKKFTEVTSFAQFRDEPIDAADPRLLYRMLPKQAEETFDSDFQWMFGLGFLLSNVVGPGFVPAVQIWFASGTADEVKKVNIYGAEASAPESNSLSIQKTIDGVLETYFTNCFISQTSNGSGWAKIHIPWSFVSQVKLLNRGPDWNQRLTGTVVKVCQNEQTCSICGVAEATGPGEWAVIECEGGFIEGTFIHLQNPAVLQFCEVEVYGLDALSTFYRSDIPPNGMSACDVAKVIEVETNLHFCVNPNYCQLMGFDREFFMCSFFYESDSGTEIPLGTVAQSSGSGCPSGSTKLFEFWSQFSMYEYKAPSCERTVGSNGDVILSCNPDTYSIVAEEMCTLDTDTINVIFFNTGNIRYTQDNIQNFFWISKKRFLGFMKLVVFADPNGANCAVKERDLAKVVEATAPGELFSIYEIYVCLDKVYCAHFTTQMKICMDSLGHGCKFTTSDCVDPQITYLTFFSYGSNDAQFRP